MGLSVIEEVWRRRFKEYAKDFWKLVCAMADVADPRQLLRIQSRSENLWISSYNRENDSIIFLLVVVSSLDTETDRAGG